MPKTALIIDDEDALRTFIKEVLVMFNIDVEEAGSGKEAIEFIKKNKRADIIFLDMNLPEMDGEDVYREICNLSADCCFIFMSGYDMSAEIEKLDEAKTQIFLKKPFGIKDIKAALDVLIPD